MKKSRFCLFVLFSLQLFSAPPKQIPHELLDQYTLNGLIPVKSWYFDNSVGPDGVAFYSKKEIKKLIKKCRKGKTNYYSATDTYLYSLMDKYVHLIQGKKVGIIGSVVPWYEAIVLAYGGLPYTIEYNKIVTDHPHLTILSVPDAVKLKQEFDVILSISSIEHDGLGRYGDPLNPNGDLESMKMHRDMLKDDGIMLLAMPVGKDAVVWNAHRVYGDIRLPLLLEGFNIVDTRGPVHERVNTPNPHPQPVFLLRKNLS